MDKSVLFQKGEIYFHILISLRVIVILLYIAQQIYIQHFEGQNC